jgi:transcriptional regulator with XRE-family HTH domain
LKYSKDIEGIAKFGKKLRKIRRSLKISQEQLAWDTGLEYSQINRIERGIINTSISNVFIIANSLKISPSILFDFSDMDNE